MKRKRFRLAETILFLSLIAFFVFVLLTRPPASFMVLLLGPIALAAVLYEFVGGLFAALTGMLAVALLLALDPHPARRAEMLQEVWPLLLTYLAVGPFIGWLVSRERERERELATTTRRLHVVQEIVEAINTSLDPQETLQTIIAETGRLIPFERAVIMLKIGDLLRVVAANDDAYTRDSLLGQAFQLNETAAGLAIEQREIWSAGPARMTQYADTRLLCPQAASSCLAIPIQFQQEVIGVFSIAGDKLQDISATDLENLTQIVDQTALAIEHARLHRLERERAKALEAISEASREIAVSLDLERTLQLVMTKAAETLPMDAGALFVFDEEAQLYRVKVSHNLPPEQVDKITFAFDEGVPGWVVKHRHPLIINDASADKRVHPYVVELGIQSVLAIPLITRGELIGVLNLFCQTGTNAFDDEALGLAQVYADQAAVFIDNARLVEELRQAAAELEARVEQRTRELRRTQAQVIRAEKMAAVGRLAGSVAHEVNNPLQAIALHLQLIADEELSPAPLEQIAILRQEFDRIAEIVQRLLDFQRPKRGNKTLQEIPALLDEVLALAGKQLQERDIRVTLELAEEIPPVSAVGDQIKQVFLNLILNAIEAMPDGGEITIRGRGSAGQVIVSFEDSGVGIAPEVMEQLFEPFFSTKHSGSGLGLAVSQEIVSAHGGILEAGRRPGQGAVFTVQLPATLQAEAVHAS